MSGLGLEFHHFGLAIEEPRKAHGFLADLGYTAGETVHDLHQRVFVSLHSHTSMPAVELIWKDGAPGPLDGILKGRTECIYHLCYSAQNRADTLDKLERSGHRVLLVSSPAPAPLFNGRLVSFHLVAGFGLVELLDK